MEFSFDEYFLKTFLIPICIVAAMSITGILSIVKICKVIPKLSNKDKPIISRYAGLVVPVLLLISGGLLIAVNINPLRYGMLLMRQSYIH